jgi:hypothetical protein
MARLNGAADAVASLQSTGHAILIYGDTKTGKTRFVGTAAQVKEIGTIHWIDTENGSQTLLNMGLSQEELAKIILYRIPDTKDNPRAIETVLKMMSAKVEGTVCDEHGTWNCSDCTTKNKPREKFLLSNCKKNDIVVIDSGSQLGTSALNAACLGKGDLYKPVFDDWGNVGKWLTDILLTVQQAKNTNFIVITHSLTTEGEDGTERTYPLMGSKPFSTNVGKYFGTVINMHIKLAKHAGASSSTYKSNLITGSRLNIAIEKAPELNMRQVLIAGGIIK